MRSCLSILIYYCIFPSYLTITMYNGIDNVERKVPKYKNHKIRKRKVKTLTRNWRDHRGIDTQKHTETVLRYFDWHGRLCQSEESKCSWTHAKMASLESWWKVPPWHLCVCLQTFTLFRLTKTAVPVEISRYSFRVFLCVYPSVTS